VGAVSGRITPSIAVGAAVLAALVAIQSPAGGAFAGGDTDVTAARKCGAARWPVKTLTDRDAKKVDFTPRPATVDGLRARRPPAHLRKRRGRGFERRTFRVDADLVEMKLEEDSDVHLVIAQPGAPSHTMIVEFPAAKCTRGAARGARNRMSRARRALTRACGRPSDRFRRLQGQGTITGVGFWDKPHGQRGVAPNAVELHPVVAFHSTNCR